MIGLIENNASLFVRMAAYVYICLLEQLMIENDLLIENLFTDFDF